MCVGVFGNNIYSVRGFDHWYVYFLLDCLFVFFFCLIDKWTNEVKVFLFYLFFFFCFYNGSGSICNGERR